MSVKLTIGYPRSIFNSLKRRPGNGRQDIYFCKHVSHKRGHITEPGHQTVPRKYVRKKRNFKAVGCVPRCKKQTSLYLQFIFRERRMSFQSLINESDSGTFIKPYQSYLIMALKQIIAFIFSNTREESHTTYRHIGLFYNRANVCKSFFKIITVVLQHICTDKSSKTNLSKQRNTHPRETQQRNGQVNPCLLTALGFSQTLTGQVAYPTPKGTKAGIRNKNKGIKR